MSHITICGTSPLRGEISLQRAKNSVLPILAATLLHRGQSRIRNCPSLSDVEAAIDILRHLGCRVQWQQGDLLVDAASLTGCTVPPALMHRCRASVLFLGALLGRCGEAELSFPGGCCLGPRPIDMHLSALQALGAEITLRGERVRCCAPRLRGREIRLPFPSVGATENAMLAAAAAEGVTVISNAAREPEIADLQSFLQKLGVTVHGAGTATVAIGGRAPLHNAEHRCIGDRIVAATYLCAVASAGGQITVRDVDYRHLTPVLTALQQAGCTVCSTADSITLASDGHLCGVDAVRTAPYPGFPTDAQPLLMAALLRARGE
ncbi:MAG: UDP-N-acetylglucosamine 1-carboxyvinyltransferase, partial [Oscillospiraceae bacterium]|nr:UDP-N-acetylglucosamine 1-carboxyvinyltransferase [Oscillospiraceae bacterium]